MVAVRHLLDSAEFDSADRLSDWCLLLSTDLNNPIALARATVTKGLTLAKKSEDAKALSYFDEALCLYDEVGDELSSAKVRLNRIKCYCDLSRYEEARRDGEISNDVFTRLGEKRLLAHSLNNLGRVFFQLDRFQEWLNTLERAAQLLEEIDDNKSLAMVYWNCGV